MQLDLSNTEIHRSIIEIAVDRGVNTVKRTRQIDDGRFLSPNGKSLSKKRPSGYCKNRSSREITSYDSNNTCNLNGGSNVKCSPKQVGGISDSKLPILTLEPHFVLKHVRLNHDKYYKDGTQDKTKIYRGVREIAFYEYLQAAISIPYLGTYASKLDLLLQGGNSASEIILPLLRLFSIICGTPNDSTSSIKANLGSKALLGANQIFNTMCLLVAYHTGDTLTTTLIKSCAFSLRHFINETIAVKKMCEFTAPYSGVAIADSGNGLSTLSAQEPYLVLKDITAPFMHPNIIDIKMGTQTYEPDAPPSKRKRELQKYPLQSKFGFRIVGMKVYDADTGTYIYRDKKFGTELLCRTDCKDALREYFQRSGSYQPTNGRCNPLLRVMSKLNQIRAWFKCYNTTLSFYASSLLIVCEGSADTPRSIPEPTLKMIDFAHVCRKEGGDPGYIHGIDNLLSILTEIYHEKNVKGKNAYDTNG